MPYNATDSYDRLRLRFPQKSVLDPQGKTIQGALKKMGYRGLEDVRQGKYFEITLDGGLSRDQAQAEVERMAREVLTNPVIEEFAFPGGLRDFWGSLHMCGIVGTLEEASCSCHP